MENRLIRFIKSRDKINTIRSAMYFVKWKLFYKWRFAECGEETLIISPMRLIGERYIFLGKGISILNNARIEAIGHYEKQCFLPSLRIGNNVSIGQNFHLICVGDLRIGNEVTISGNVYISDVLHSYRGKDVNILKQDLIMEHTEIGDYCFIGYGATIQPGVVLGKQCIVGANAVVLRGRYPDYSVLVGVPAKIVIRLDEESGEWKKCKV